MFFPFAGGVRWCANTVLILQPKKQNGVYPRGLVFAVHESNEYLTSFFFFVVVSKFHGHEMIHLKYCLIVSF